MRTVAALFLVIAAAPVAPPSQTRTYDTSEKRNEQNWGGTTAGVTYTTKVKKHETENYTLTLTRGRLGGVRITSTGSASMESEAEQRMETANKSCFPQDAAGVVRDTGFVTGVSDVVVDRQTSKGVARAPLLSPKLRLTQFEGTWMLAVESISSGEGEGRSTSERSGGCGAWSKVDPAGTGRFPYGRLISFAIDNLREIQNDLSGRQVLSATDGEHESVVFKLTRK